MFLPLNWRDKLLDGLGTGWMTTLTVNNQQLNVWKPEMHSVSQGSIPQTVLFNITVNGTECTLSILGITWSRVMHLIQRMPRRENSMRFTLGNLCKGDNGLLAKWAHTNLIELHKVKCKTLHLVRDIPWCSTDWAKNWLRTALQRMGGWWMTNWI